MRGETYAYWYLRRLGYMSITADKHEILVRTARYFLRERHIDECPVRFDVVGINNAPGQPPVVRLHKAALSPEGPCSH